LGGAVLAGSWLEAAGRPAFWAVPALAVLILALARTEDGALARWLGSRPLVFLGQASYALYMTHAICQLVLAHMLPPARFADSGLPVRAGVALIYIAVVIGSAMAVYRFVEEPSRRWMRRRLPH
jgi:peptidoglycan/LPS O-acetylase OafA/YrhL